jgi:hypothetical protein
VKLFLSWSGELSRRVATALHDWLPYMIQTVKPFLSSGGDISKGEQWGKVLQEELKDAQYGIICVTPYNLCKPWMTFEAGVLSKFIGRSAVTPFLFRVNQSVLAGGPLSQFEATEYSEEDMLNLIYSINEQSELQVDRGVLQRTFGVWWKDLKQTLDDIPSTFHGETRTPYKWLYASEDFEAFRDHAECRSVWIITPDVFRHATNSKMKESVNDKARAGVKYRYFLPSSKGTDEEDQMRELKQMAESSKGNLEYKVFDRDRFYNLAVTDYIIFNVDTGSNDQTQMFLKLPITDPESDYWIRVDERSAVNFTNRFRDLWTAPD